ncbi:hypothetical protein B4U80_05001 [Leptotrombidium deliense]|uniref:Tim10-like domain-containing protein n=1 Tax=Leptotrombidium deliense TaxID=299467 RepID=A0A443SL68_9ACAR|nr:hypothetical protein B4U80_05001 [Leptotrombidium deliense]
MSGTNLSSTEKDALMHQVKEQIAIANAQELLEKMSEKCFLKCINKPGTSLDSSESNSFRFVLLRLLSSEMEKRRKAKEARLQEDRMRDELLSQTFSNSRDGHTSIAMDSYYAKENESLLNFHRNVDDMLAQGGNVLSNLRDQRNMLKGVHKRVVDIGNTLGLSNTVMRLIEKRTYFDRFILFGGMAVFVLFMFLCWYFFL